ncbi:hypothetical protein BDR03DRAFT_284028 [Suillus americanus]|nr:hypothetical protein BDR03DRAFT_284028 [Suillus americanus]
MRQGESLSARNSDSPLFPSETMHAKRAHQHSTLKAAENDRAHSGSPTVVDVRAIHNTAIFTFAWHIGSNCVFMSALKCVIVVVVPAFNARCALDGTCGY